MREDKKETPIRDRMTKEEIAEGMKDGTIVKEMLSRSMVAGMAIAICKAVFKQHSFIIQKINPPPSSLSGLGKVDWDMAIHKQHFDIAREVLEEEDFVEKLVSKLDQLEERTFREIAKGVDNYLDGRIRT